MAEIVGLVASGISIAQVAGEIITVGIKIKGLLDEVKDAPETLLALLDRVSRLVPVLCSISVDTDSTPLSVSLHSALHGAVSSCMEAAKQLELLARDLSDEIDATHGARRKLKMAKVILRKSLLQKYENRLQAAVQHLSLAQQTYILYAWLSNKSSVNEELDVDFAQWPSAGSAQPHSCSGLESSRCPKLTPRSCDRKCAQYHGVHHSIEFDINTKNQEP